MQYRKEINQEKTKPMYPFHQVYLFHASPAVERDSANVTFDIDLQSHTWDFADDFFDDDVHQVHIVLVMVIERDLSTLTKNLYIITKKKVAETTQIFFFIFRNIFINFFFLILNYSLINQFSPIFIKGNQ